MTYGYPGEVDAIRAKLAEDRAYRPRVTIDLVPPLFRRPEYRYQVEVGCDELGTCNRDCRACARESTVVWEMVGRLVDLSPDPGAGYPRVRFA